MDVKTQQLIIIILGIIGIVSILKGNMSLVDIIVAGLIGFIGQKTLTDKQSEIIEKQIIDDSGEDVQ